MSEIEFKVEPGKIEDDSIAARWMILTLDGVDVFTEFVYDTDREGNRSEEQAAKNLIRLFAHRLKKVLENG